MPTPNLTLRPNLSHPLNRSRPAIPPTTLHLVTLFQDINYAGNAWSFDRSAAYVGDEANDQASSFVVAPGYTATFYRDADYTNQILSTSPSDDPWVGQIANDTISSLRIYEAGTNRELNPQASHPVTIFEDINYGGQQWGFDASTAYVGDAANDQGSSVVIENGYKAIFYKDADYVTPIWRLSDTDNGSYIGDSYNDTISALRVFETSTGREIKTLSSCRVTFYTTDEDKDHDTALDIDYYDPNGTMLAEALNNTGQFDNDSIHEFTLGVSREVTVDFARGGMLRVHITPNGDDTWRFGVLVELLADDNNRSLVSTFFGGLSLDENNRQIDLQVNQAASPGQSFLSFLEPISSGDTIGLHQTLRVYAENVPGIEFTANYATDPSDSATVGWRGIGSAQQTSPNIWTLDWDTTSLIDAGNSGWGTVLICASATGSMWTGRLSPRVYTRVDIENALPLSGVQVAITQPQSGQNVAGGVQIVVNTSGVHGVKLWAYCRTSPGQAPFQNPLGLGNPIGGGVYTVNFDTTRFPDQGDPSSNTVDLQAIPTGQYSQGLLPEGNCRVNILNHPAVTVPNVVGMLLDAAANAVDAVGLVATPSGASGFGPFTVISQSPPGGASVALGSPVTLAVVPVSTGISAVRCDNNTTDEVPVDIWTWNGSQNQKKGTVQFGSTLNVSVAANQTLIVRAYDQNTAPPSQARAEVTVVGKTGGPVDVFTID